MWVGRSCGGALQLSTVQQYSQMTPLDSTRVNTSWHSGLLVSVSHFALSAHPLVIWRPEVWSLTVVRQNSSTPEHVTRLGASRHCSPSHLEHDAIVGVVIGG